MSEQDYAAVSGPAEAGGQNVYRSLRTEALNFDATKSVGGEPVRAEDFAYVGDLKDKSTWKLPIHDEAHVRNALARFNQADIPADKKKEVARKLVSAAKKYKIDTSGFEEQYLSVGTVPCPQARPLDDKNRDRHIAVLLNGPGAVVRTAPETSGTRPLLREIPIAVIGTWVKAGRKFSISPDDLTAMVRNFEKRKNEMVVIDYEHASEMPQVARGGPVPAAGWIHSLRLTTPPSPTQPRGVPPLPPAGEGRGVTEGGDLGEVLYATVEWTADAEEMIRRGKYRFFSPAIDWGGMDKETGELQGATLTSGALTNHPFLEELPPIVLTDAELLLLTRDPASWEGARCVDISQVHQDGYGADASVGFGLPARPGGPTRQDGPVQAGPQSKGGKPVGKKLAFRKMADKKMFRKVFDDEGVELGEISLDDLDLDDSELETLRARQRGGTSERLADRLSDILNELGADQHDSSALEAFHRNVATLRVEGVERAARAALLSETLKDNAINLDLAAKLADQGRLSFSDYRAVQKAHELVEKAIAAGKFLPADREFVSRLALSEPERFEAWARKKPRAVPLGGPTGVGASNSETPAQDLSLRLTELMQEKNLSRPKALQEIARSDPELIRRWRWGTGQAGGS